MLLSKKTIVMACFGLCLGTTAFSYYNLPPLPSPDQYGDVVMDRLSSDNDMQAVVFSHWSHRARYSCRVCHYELGFELSAGQTEISEDENRDGDFCGACHDGTQAFGHTEEYCSKCHTGPRIDRRAKFTTLRKRLPKAEFGNKVDWAKGLQRGIIKPLYSLFKPEEVPMTFDKRLELAAEWNWVPPAIFNHSTHTPWLDCSNCHPDVFNIQKKGTKHFLMEFILEKKFCGVCHFSVALPMDDCHACHPEMKQKKKR